MYSSGYSVKQIGENLTGLKSMDGGSKSSEKDEIKRNVARYDKKLLRWLVDFYQALSGETIDMDKVTDLVELLEKIKKTSTNSYLHDLVYPEYAKTAKVPIEFPIPTSSFQIHNQISLTTNSTGQLAIIFNPYYLEQGAATNSTFFVNNSGSLTGSAPDNFFTSTAIGTTIPVEIYQNYRLVSAAIHVRYVHRLDAASGVFGGAVNFENVFPAAIGLTSLDLSRYGNFNYIDDSYFSQRANVLDGIRLVYVPYDNSVQEFQQLGSHRAGCNFLIYAQNFPASVSCLRADVFLNFESTLDPVFQNYVPSSYGCRGSATSVKSSVEYLTQKNMVSAPLSNFENTPKAEKSKIIYTDTASDKTSWLEDIGSAIGGYYETAKKWLPSIQEIASMMMGSFL